jgi:hypothetical protein
VNGVGGALYTNENHIKWPESNTEAYTKEQTATQTKHVGMQYPSEKINVP